jgi:hypothetical protein
MKEDIMKVVLANAYYEEVKKVCKGKTQHGESA